MAAAEHGSGAAEAGARRWCAPAVLAAVAGASYAVGLASAGFFDNEGRYAEVARQMVLRGDWVTPYLNDVPILTKPPLTQWLTAIVFTLTGPSEWARLVSVAASMLTLIAACRLGEALFDRTTGLVGGVLLATMIGFSLEARTLRPDAILVACSTWGMLLWYRAETGAAAARGRRLALLWGVLGVGMLAKGFVPLVVVGPPIALWMFRRHGWGAVSRMRPGLALAVLAVVVLPWHVAAALANPGFAWDYVVNQHLLFALDKKEPRDSEGDTLVFFWLATLFRTLPWGLIAPLTARRAAHEAVAGPAAPMPTLLLWAWLLGHGLVFSLTPSRLEHYTLPAHPAVALLAARVLVGLAGGESGRAVRGWIVIVGFALAAAGGVLLVLGGNLLAREYWIPQAPAMLDLVPWAGAVLLAGGVAAGLATLAGRGRVAGAALALLAALMSGICARALVVATPLFSWKPVANAIRQAGLADGEIVFEAGVEYQLVGGLDFYLERSVTLLEPAAGFVPPTYLAGRTTGMFVPRSTFGDAWRSGRPMLLVSDPERRRDRPDGIAPGPSEPLARFGDRWILLNSAWAR